MESVYLLGIFWGFAGVSLICIFMIVVYIISTHVGTFYTGITNSIIRRWREHVRGKSSYLRCYRPVEVVYIEFCNDRASAARRERYIKNIGAKRFLLNVRYKWPQ